MSELDTIREFQEEREMTPEQAEALRAAIARPPSAPLCRDIAPDCPCPLSMPTEHVQRNPHQQPRQEERRMSSWFETFLAIVIVMAIIGVIGAVIGSAAYCSCVDYTQAKFEPGEMVKLKVGGMGQVLSCTGVNHGLPWNLMPVFKYEVRQSTNNGVRTTTFQEWELQNPC